MASSAVRLSVVIGLHLDLPEAHLSDLENREHLRRLWWTSYVLDHTCAMISSHQVSISDDDIFVHLPSNTVVVGPNLDDFQDARILNARISLVKLTRKIVKSVYSRSTYTQPFLHRVQHALRDLQQWLNSLPRILQIQPQNPLPTVNAISLSLFFNQVSDPRPYSVQF